MKKLCESFKNGNIFFLHLQTKIANLGNICNKLQHWGTNTLHRRFSVFVNNLSKSKPLIIILFFSFFSGYDRSLPGFPRYKVLGSEETGEFSLEVVNATLEDDAIYECQVGPSFNNKPIRASARLNVMCKFNFHVIELLGRWCY